MPLDSGGKGGAGGDGGMGGTSGDGGGGGAQPEQPVHSGLEQHPVLMRDSNAGLVGRGEWRTCGFVVHAHTVSTTPSCARHEMWQMLAPAEKTRRQITQRTENRLGRDSYAYPRT